MLPYLHSRISYGGRWKLMHKRNILRVIRILAIAALVMLLLSTKAC